MEHRKIITDLNGRRALFMMKCFYSPTSLVVFLLVKEAVVGSYSLYQLHESPVSKELLPRFLFGEGEGEKKRIGG